ncbi:hypothetical protein CDN99_08130 [Roseateles aquatilis]|uniref:Iron ABC transporter substrate-binding protein n=1 Tax=Roseateles aquatilis TaxID=431061 RepID=A0A246JI46_9BURK|nr:extracellular solute-binding protein [Roseateles aquatilis]OWQ92291.1 hypothetical protein CDN99_08130 [Roseateles aquatilis]
MAATLAMCLVAPLSAETIKLVCSSREWCGLLRSKLAGSKNLPVEITELGTTEAFELIVAEKNRPRHDVWFGGTGDYHFEAAKRRLTLAYRSPNISLLDPWGEHFAEQSGYRSNGLHSGALSFIVNTEVLAGHRLPEPRCWSDLARPEYRALIQLGKPGGLYSVITTVVQLMGEEEGFRYLRALDPNINYVDNGQIALANVDRGNAAIAIAFAYGLNAAVLDGRRVKAVIPCEGTGYEIVGLSIIKGGPNPNGAKRFFDWALTAEAQKLMGQSQPLSFHSGITGRTDGRIVDPPPTRLINYDFFKYGSLEERDRLLHKWAQVVEAGRRR